MPTAKTIARKAAFAAKMAALPHIPPELVDQFVKGPMTGEAVNAASMAFKKALIERAMGAELSHHLGYAPGQLKPDVGDNQPNQRNGKTSKTVRDRPSRNLLLQPNDVSNRFSNMYFPVLRFYLIPIWIAS